MQGLKGFFADSILYTFMNSATKVINLFLLIFLTNEFTRESYGMLVNIDSLIGILGYLIIFGTDSALAYYYIEEESSKSKVLYVQNVMTFRLAIAFFFFVLSLLGGNLISSLYGEVNFGLAVQISMLTLILDSAFLLLCTVYRFDLQTKKVIALNLLKLIGIVCLTYIFIYSISSSINSIIYARLISAVVVLLFLFNQSYIYFKLNFNREILVKILQYAAPLVPVSISVWALNSSSTFFITFLMSKSYAGTFGVAIRFAMLISLLTYGIQMAWRPYSTRLAKNKNAPLVFSKVYTVIFSLGMLFIVLITLLMGVDILFKAIVGKNFWDARYFVSLLSLGSFLNFFYLILSTGLFVTKNTKNISIYFGISALVNVFLNFVLIYNFGLWGAVASYLITNILLVILTFRHSQVHWPVPFDLKKNVGIFLITILVICTILWMQIKQSSWLGIIVITVIYAISIYYAGIHNEKKFLYKEHKLERSK